MRLAVLEGNGAQTTTIVRSERSSFADFEISQPSSPLVRLRHPKPDLNKVYKLYGHTTGANKN